MQNDLHCGRFALDLSRPLVMGVLNITPDSFSDGGRWLGRDAALRQAENMLQAGVDIIDIGGESTRPQAESVPVEIECERVLPVITALKNCGVPLSIDTQKPLVMQAAIAAGVDMVNDISGLEAEGAIAAIANSTVAVCLMHKQGNAQTMQTAPYYVDVVQEVRDYLLQRAQLVEQAGVASNRIILDVGFGFGKTLQHNVRLFQQLAQFATLPYPLLVGVSRKSMLGELVNKPVGERLIASVSAALLAVQQGAAIVRVHDVAETRDALTILQVLSTNKAFCVCQEI